MSITTTMSKEPAWKRVGLRVKQDVEAEPLGITEHLDGDVLTNKLAKKLNKKRHLKETSAKNKQKKPPKRQKVAKAERGPPPEKDQLAYLRQYAGDRENWKFSKQKQNWVLKNIEQIPAEYEDALVAYIEGIQGGARARLEGEFRAVVEKWNVVAEELERKVEAELYGEKSDDKEKSTEEKPKEEPKVRVTREYAIRCKKLLDALTEDTVELKGVDEEKESEEAAEKEEEKAAEKSLAESLALGELSSESDSESERESGSDSGGSEDSESDESDKEDNLVINEVEVETFEFPEKK